MTPAVFWILVGFICLLIGAVIIFTATRRHDGKEPDSRTTWEPDYDYYVRRGLGLTEMQWACLAPHKKIQARDDHWKKATNGRE